jgi:hypothetical protein
MFDPSATTIALLVLVARLGDLLSTWLVSPTLLLENNEAVRRWRWPFAVLTLGLAGVPYLSREAGIAIATASLLVTSANLSAGWVARGAGEAAYLELLRRAVAGTRRGVAELFVLAAAACPIVVGLITMRASREVAPFAFWAGFGVAMYGVALAIHRSTFIGRVRRMAGLNTPAL